MTSFQNLVFDLRQAQKEFDKTTVLNPDYTEKYETVKRLAKQVDGLLEVITDDRPFLNPRQLRIDQQQ